MRRIRSAFFRQAFLTGACLFVFCGGLSDAFGQKRHYRPPVSYASFSKPDQEEGRRNLEEFRQQGINGGYFLEFQLRVMPRRGEERFVNGRMWGARNEQGPISRVELLTEKTSRLLVQNGPKSRVWTWKAGGQVAEPGVGALFTPLAGTDLTPFELQMPFIFWDDFVYEGVVPLRGRPARRFLLYPPENVIAQKPELTGIRVYLDSQFMALVQAEMIGGENKVLRTLSVMDLKKIDEQWMVKTIDLRDDVTRNKTRFSVKGAALGLIFSPQIFAPEHLKDTAMAPEPERVRSMGN